MKIDTEATATYVRFGRGKVAHTEPYGGTGSLVMVDYDKRGRVLGIEFIGRRKFNVAELLADITCLSSKVLARSGALCSGRLDQERLKGTASLVA